MKKQIIIFMSIMFAVAYCGIATANDVSLPVAKPILCFDWHSCRYSNSPLHELFDCEKEIAQTNKEYDVYDQKQEIVFEKANTVIERYVKQLGASAVVEKHGIIVYITPKYDITQRVIDELNKEYDSTHTRPVLSQPQKTDLALLHEAILDDSTEKIETLVQKGVDINLSQNGRTPLSWAVLYKKNNAVKILLKYGAKADDSLFQESLKLQNIKSAILLAINCGANLNAVYSDGYHKGTLLQLASRTTTLDFEGMLALIENGADYSGYTPVFGNNEFYVGDPATLMENIIRYGHNEYGMKLIQKAIDNGYNVNDVWRIGTKITIPSGGAYLDNNIIKLLITNGANPNQFFETSVLLSPYWSGGAPDSSWTPLFSAISSAKKDVVKTLLDAGADINKKANPHPKSPYFRGLQTPLSFAISKGEVAIAELLRKHGATV